MEIASLRQRDGIAALALAIFVALFLFAAIILLTGQSNTSITSGKYSGDAEKARFLASTGLQDAKLLIARNPTLAASLSYSTYTISSVDGTTSVYMTNGNGPFGWDWIVTVTGQVDGPGGSIIWRRQATISTSDGDGKISSTVETDL